MVSPLPHWLHRYPHPPDRLAVAVDLEQTPPIGLGQISLICWFPRPTSAGWARCQKGRHSVVCGNDAKYGHWRAMSHLPPHQWHTLQPFACGAVWRRAPPHGLYTTLGWMAPQRTHALGFGAQPAAQAKTQQGLALPPLPLTTSFLFCTI
eukprot:GGOE01011396.1.p3 GENE.GGOE01011396.1~~GGOE01011396.1.p3  ORF type:complete len:150 (+),score=3.38 GGOE01011396.1:1053-1502(+)